MVGERLRVPDGQAAGSAVLLRLPTRTLSAAAVIAGSRLSNEEIAELLCWALPVPIRPRLVQLWREGAEPAPDDQVIEILLDVIPLLPPAAARRAS